MVNLKIEYNTDFSAHHSYIQVDEAMLLSKIGSFKDEIVIARDDDEVVKVILGNYLSVEKERMTNNPFKVFISSMTMFFILASSMFDYDFDCWDYQTEITLRLKEPSPSVIISVSEQEEHKKAMFYVEGYGCEIVSQKTISKINKEYVNVLFNEYFAFNIIVTSFFSTISVMLSIIGIIAQQVTTIIFPLIFVALFILMHLCTKRKLNKMKESYLKQQ